MALLSYALIYFATTLVALARLTKFEQSISCTYKGKTNALGKFRPSPCEHCQCTSSGRAFCAMPRCAQPSCVDYVNKPDQCCPDCPNGPNCSYNGRIIKQGDTYQPDPLTVCTCHSKPSYGGFGLGGSTTAICAMQAEGK